MAHFPRYKVFVFLAVSGLAAGGAAWLVHSGTKPSGESPSPPKRAENDAPLPPMSASPFLNTSASAKYVGSDVCAECHREPHQTYSETAHSKALFKVDPAQEPPDGEYRHAASGRTYAVYRRDGKLWHRETAGDAKSGPIDLGDFPAKYTIGSGRFSRSYLMEIDGFLVESPITWYAAKKAWRLSPGYDRPVHAGFTRAADVGCLHCHSGRVEAVEGSLHRIKVHEFAVSCENCHGPGSLHVSARRAKRAPKGGIDHTIVHPGRLSRELNEAICAQCHLRGQATTFLRGRGMHDFRPGLPLTDFRIDYQLETPADSMKVVGHLEQMHRSRCYTQTKTLTCTTCHNPHFSPDEKSKVAYYRNVCNSCHDGNGKSCKLPHKSRIAKNAQDNCVACHMPQVPTDLPHFAFTHHRIGIGHAKQYEESHGDGRRLVPLSDDSRLPQVERDRCLGLAYLELAGLSEPQAARGYVERGYTLLRKVYAAGVRDSDMLAAMARMHWERDSDLCLPFARQTLDANDCTPQARVNALLILGERNLRLGRYDESEQALTKLVRCRRHPADWQLLGTCRLKRNDVNGAIAAFQKAVAIRPDDPAFHELLAGACAQAGRSADAKRHRERARQLARLGRRPGHSSR